MEAVEILWQASFWVAAIRIASPLIFATMGELICERAGVLNLGIEGIMTAGAFAGWITVYAGGDLWTGVAVAALTGAAFGLLHGVLTPIAWRCRKSPRRRRSNRSSHGRCPACRTFRSSGRHCSTRRR